MNEDKIKHLELIQSVITRHAQNSFALKGWGITLVAAIFVLSSKESNQVYFLIALIPTLAFWGLDGYYLRQERLFRKLYDSVRILDSSELENNPFSMDTLPFTFPEFSQTMSEEHSKIASWWRTCWSTTIGIFYGSIVTAILIVAIVAIYWC